MTAAVLAVPVVAVAAPVAAAAVAASVLAVALAVAVVVVLESVEAAVVSVGSSGRGVRLENVLPLNQCANFCVDNNDH